MRKFLFILFFLVRILFDKSVCASAHSGGGGEEFGGSSGGGGSDFGYDTSIFVDHDASNSYSLTALNQVTCDASVSVDKILVVQDSLELSKFTIRPILSDNAAGSKVTLTLYAGYDQYDMHKVKEVTYEPDMMIVFNWYEHFKTDLMKLENIHFMIVPEVRTEDFSKPRTYKFPMQVTAHDCDPDNTNYVPGGMSHDAEGIYLMPLYSQISSGTIREEVEKDGIFVLLWTIEPEKADNAWAASECLFYTRDSDGNWEWEAIGGILYTADYRKYTGYSPFYGTWMKAGTAWSEYLTFSMSPQYVIPWRDADRDAIPALYFDSQETQKTSTGKGFYCSFPMNSGIMQRTGSGVTVGDGGNMDEDLEKDYDSETGDRTESSQNPLDMVLDFLFGTSEIQKTSAIAQSRIPFSFFSYLPSIVQAFDDENYSGDKLHFDIRIHLGKYFGEQHIRFNLNLFDNEFDDGGGHLIHDLVFNLFRLLAYMGTGFFLFGIIQKTANFLSD